MHSEFWELDWAAILFKQVSVRITKCLVDFTPIELDRILFAASTRAARVEKHLVDRRMVSFDDFGSSLVLRKPLMTTILVVDDSSVDRKLANGLLMQESGWNVIEAVDGNAALAAI